MCTAWEEKLMNKTALIAKYELKMQIRRIGGWLVFAFSMVLALLDDFPSAANVKRLAELPKQGYVVYRLIGQPGIILLFGLMFLLSNRIRGDWKSGTLDLFTTAPIRKAQYLGGKILGNFGYLLCMTGLYLAVNGVIQAVFTPGQFTAIPYFVGFIVVIFPACFFCIHVLVGNPRAFGHPPVLLRIRRLFYGKSYHRSGKGSKRLTVLVPADRGLKQICLSV
jgi:ABC-type transport system involved in multi-copper enzyme maturation permease subunit